MAIPITDIAHSNEDNRHFYIIIVKNTVAETAAVSDDHIKKGRKAQGASEEQIRKDPSQKTHKHSLSFPSHQSEGHSEESP